MNNRIKALRLYVKLLQLRKHSGQLQYSQILERKVTQKRIRDTESKIHLVGYDTFTLDAAMERME